MLSSSSSVRRWKASRVSGKEGCGGPSGRGTRGASSSWRVAIFLLRRALLGRVKGAIFLDVCRWMAGMDLEVGGWIWVIGGDSLRGLVLLLVVLQGIPALLFATTSGVLERIRGSRNCSGEWVERKYDSCVLGAGE